MYGTSLAVDVKRNSVKDTKNTDRFSNLDNVALDVSAKSNEVLELLFNEYELIEKIKDDAVDNLIILKKFLVDYDAIVSAFVSKFNDPKVLDELHKYWDRKRQVIGTLIDGNTDLDPYIELETILNYTSDYYNALLNNEVVEMHTAFDLDSQKNVTIDSVDVDKSVIESNGDSTEKFSISNVDELYSKLYDAINSKNAKNETVYRGRIIRTLKKNRKLIDDEYEKVQCLDEINNLLSENADFSRIVEVLNKEENKNYLAIFSDYLSNRDSFSKKFLQVYEEKCVRKKSLYKNALDIELKEHGKNLDERFSNEFLEKKGTFSSLVTVLPNAIALSTKKLGNTINQLKEAKTNRMKVAKGIQVVKDSGKVIATPVVYMGKFLVNNWYALYSIYKGVNAAKEQQAQEERIRQEEFDAQEKAEHDARVRAERDRIASERGNAIAEEEKRKALAAREDAERREMAAQAEAEAQAAREEAARKQAEAYAQAQETARKEAERRKMMESYNNAMREQAEAEARYHHEAGTYAPEPQPAPETSPDDLIDDSRIDLSDRYYFGSSGTPGIPSINPIFIG